MISATYMHFGRLHGWAMPQSSKYRSRASRSLHEARGSQVVSPSIHLTCQGTTCFPLRSCLGVLPTPTSDTFGILRTPTTSEFQRHFKVLPIPSPFQQSPMLLHVPSTPTSCPTPLPKAAPRPPPPLKITQRPHWTPHPPI